MGDCQNYGPFLGPYYTKGPNLGDPEKDHNFDNLPLWIPGLRVHTIQLWTVVQGLQGSMPPFPTMGFGFRGLGLGCRV